MITTLMWMERPEYNNPGRNSSLRTVTCQMTADLTFTCPQTGNDQPVSLGMPYGQHVDTPVVFDREYKI